jgi:hypothetical protein
LKVSGSNAGNPGKSAQIGRVEANFLAQGGQPVRCVGVNVRAFTGCTNKRPQRSHELDEMCPVTQHDFPPPLHAAHDVKLISNQIP